MPRKHALSRKRSGTRRTRSTMVSAMSRRIRAGSRGLAKRGRLTQRRGGALPLLPSQKATRLYELIRGLPTDKTLDTLKKEFEVKDVIACGHADFAVTGLENGIRFSPGQYNSRYGGKDGRPAYLETLKAALTIAKSKLEDAKSKITPDDGGESQYICGLCHVELGQMDEAETCMATASRAGNQGATKFLADRTEAIAADKRAIRNRSLGLPDNTTADEADKVQKQKEIDDANFQSTVASIRSGNM